jgi:type IV pilus assembly protein PilY1
MKSLTKEYRNMGEPLGGTPARHRLARIGAFFIGMLAATVPVVTNATQLSLSNAPLFLSTPVPANIFFLMDDSGSMDWNMVTDEGGDGIMTLTNGGRSTDYNYLFGKSANGLNNNSDNVFSSCCTNGRVLPTEEAVLATSNMPADALGVWRGRYAGYNHMYYDPEVTYRPWEGVDSAGTPFADAVPTAVRLDPYSATSATVDVTQDMTWISDNVPDNSGSAIDITLGSGTVPAFYPAMYYVWTDDSGGSANGVVDADDTHTKVEIRSANAPFAHTTGNRTDCANPFSCTYAEEIRNFANWFSYYRRRVLTAKNAAGKVIASSTSRMGYASLHNNGSGDTHIALMNQATNTGNKKTLLDGLYQMRASGATPLRNKLDATGEYFKCASGNIFGDAASNPGDANCPVLSQANGGNCQQNFGIVMTDGYYNDSYSGVGNEDGDSDTSYDGGAYADSYSDTLADIAQNYYEHDLHTSLPDNVSVTAGIDNATHQHLVTYTVAFGVNGTLTAGPTDSTAAFSWPDPTAGDPEKIDDLRHAAYNGRGEFLNAQSPDALATALSDSIASITDRTGSAATVAVNSRTLSTTTVLYQARFTSGEWNGDLQAIGIDTNGNVQSPLWSAGDQVKTQNWDTGRTIITFNGTNGIPFRWNTAALSSAQQTVLNTDPATSTFDGEGKARLNWLRGSTLDEGTNNNYRVRANNNKLGDIVNSSPIYAGPPIFLPDLETVPHSTYRAAYLNRPAMLYVGANDGMLHGFDAATGLEKIAYIPNIAFSNLNKLTDSNYSHRYFVDGSPAVGDVFGAFSGATGCAATGCWRTIVVGGLGAGGKGYFALDATDPTGMLNSSLAFSEANAANIALWEFADSTTPDDMGYSFSQATIAKMQDGEWAAIFGNGYNSVNERPVLYIVNAISGTLIKKVILQSATGGSNGLSTPAVIDKDGDFVADYIYAGDLKGNMWKVDVSNSNPNNWDSAYKSGSTPDPLFAAVDGSSNPQPITVRPEVGPNPDGEGGYMVYFGTGRYITTGDNVPASSPIQTFYGIWDKNVNGAGTPVTRADLLPQTMGTATVSSQTVRSVTNTAMQWRTGNSGTCNPPTSGYDCLGWRTDLLTATSGYIGEMNVSNPVLLGGVLPRVIFTTLIPDNNACQFGGSGWLIELNPRNGGQLSDAVFDLDGDGAIGSGDKISGTTPVAGINPGLGIMPEPVILRDPAHKTDLKISTGSTGAVKALKNHVGETPSSRQSWRQIK